MESDYDVCVECGSLAECEHDRETGSTTAPASLLSNIHPLSHGGTSASSEIDYLEMRTVQPILPFSEVFNTYGSLPNAALLSRYGFSLPENEYDTIRMVFNPFSTVRNLFKHVGLEEASVGEDDHAVTGASMFGYLAIRNTFREQQPYSQGIVDSEATPLSVRVDELSASGAVSHLSEEPAWENITNRLLHVFTYVAGTWNSDPAWDEQDDGLVFNAQQSPLTGSVSHLTGDASVRISHDLVINSDGKMSHNLWLLCILVALFAARSHLAASFEDLIERVERGREAIASLAELKAKLISVQGWAERLRHIHDGDSVDGDMEGGGSNHGSTFFPPFPHLARPSPNVDYDTESDEFAQPGPAIEPRGTLTCITAAFDSPHWDSSKPKSMLSRPLGTGPQDPEISTSFSPIPQASFEVPQAPCHPMLQATMKSFQETSSSSMRTYMDHATGYSPHRARDRSRSAERVRPMKRIRRCCDSVVANRESWRADRLGRGAPESARGGENRQVLDVSDDDDIQMTNGATHRVALLLARVVVGLCHDRYRSPLLSKEERGIGMTAAELGEVLDVSVFVSFAIRYLLVRPLIWWSFSYV
ncbi:hypothetical protein J3R83DRAFT_8285 [Lanmaoa asiatica]|nr:hypothetical protein J3R83DRAFT_8285 [Lanmaoa asiatica]